MTETQTGDPYPPYNPPVYPQQGWQCPVCKSVYAPSVFKCFSCPPMIVAKDYTEFPPSAEIKKFWEGDKSK